MHDACMFNVNLCPTARSLRRDTYDIAPKTCCPLTHIWICMQAGCCCTPDVAAFELTERDQFLILGCDGFWGAWDAQGCVDAAAELLLALERGSSSSGGGGRDVEKVVTNRLLNIAVRERGAKDNCSVVLVRFQRSGV